MTNDRVGWGGGGGELGEPLESFSEHRNSLLGGH